jgi:hypothetical protein
VREGFDLHDLGVEALEGISGVEVVERKLVLYPAVDAAMGLHRCFMARRRGQPPAGRNDLRLGGAGCSVRGTQEIFA